MKIKKIINLTIIVLCLCLVTGVGVFIYDAQSSYNINRDFVSVPLKFNPDDSTSTYKTPNAQVTVSGGFVKGLQKGNDGTKSLVIRALSPLPKVTVKGDSNATISLLIENINPDFYSKSIAGSNLPMTKVAVNTLKLSIVVSSGKTIKIEPLQSDSTGKYQYIILGDNRDGYDTFDNIIQQVNGKNPVFVIDNGDLVFSGKRNQYRLFNQMLSKISTTVCTTLGNHDIRGSGRDTYTMLYGPAYYSFDIEDSHFVFMDSSPGWSEKQAISNQQYTWLEKDLKKSQGKRIFVVTHIPPHDPRSGVTPNKIPNYVNEVENGDNWAEQKLNNYNETKDMEHGFQDPQEAAKFENLMSTYHVDTVYLSHIHSYLEYTKDGVRYLISGGAGAELLTKNSYYHYMIAKIGDIKSVTMVELPSPANNYLTRYTATAQLFGSAMYEENPVAVVFVIIGFVLFIFLLIIKIYLRKKQPLDNVWKWFSDIGKYAVKRFRELFRNSDKN
ncbi:metallophosphoesterase [Clostridium sp.]|uniref:metallophosphoesterase family protein n=1 Tax=Clostridium sp. TaxID=1506 RepID=UPI001A3F04EF|nr:metallophosphoesterase [Clostridium sp.]MBK5236748.1 metallophosphoesterase [Clostridium sp.]